jgi:Glycosyl transferase family 2
MARSKAFKVPRIVVAIPIHNEAEYIEDCLAALARQDHGDPFEVVALLNNCSDDTARIARGLASSLPYELHIRESWLDPAAVNAGVARRMATQFALSLAGQNGIILTTDADGKVATNWIAANIAAIDAGADVVAGMAVLDDRDADALPDRLLIDDEKEVTFGALLDEIDCLLDPDAADPWPRHTQHSGASIAVRAGFLASAGGVPAIPLGEDRGLFTRLRHIDAHIRHAKEVTVTVSGRAVGRAKGGMADTIARRLREPDQWLDDAMEPAANRTRRAALRARARNIWMGRDSSAEALAKALRLPVALVRQSLKAPTFGAAWSDLEKWSPILGNCIVPVREVERETDHARAIIRALHVARRPVGIDRSAAVRPAAAVVPD